MSSELPDKLRGVAEAKGVLCRTGARGMVFNADGAQMLLLIQMGTVGASRPPPRRVVCTDVAPSLLIDRVPFSKTPGGTGSASVLPIIDRSRAIFQNPPCSDLWAMSSPLEDDEAARPGDHQLRSRFVNKLSAARRFGDFVRGLWPATAEQPGSPSAADYEPAVGDAPPPGDESAPEPLADSQPEPAPAAESPPESASEPAVIDARPPASSCARSGRPRAATTIRSGKMATPPIRAPGSSLWPTAPATAFSRSSGPTCC